MQGRVAAALLRTLCTFACGFGLGVLLGFMWTDVSLNAMLSLDNGESSPGRAASVVNGQEGTFHPGGDSASAVPLSWHPDFRNSNPQKTGPRLLCYLLVGPTTHASARHVKETWGKRCDKLIFFSTAADASLPTTVLTGVPEGYSLLWGKARGAMEYLHRREPGFEWYLKADDDTFVIVENLRSLLGEKDPSTPVYYGVKLKLFVKQGYMSGGGGYAFSREALRRFNEVALRLNDTDLCPHHRSTGAEDVNVGQCFESAGVAVGESRDAAGRPRFFSHGPEALFYRTSVLNPYSWYWKSLAHPHVLGPECCSEYTISFHGVRPRMMWSLEVLLYKIKVHRPPVAGPVVPKLASEVRSGGSTANSTL